MKLLLTSSGIKNPSLVQGLEKLLGKSVQGTKMAFIPTAANVEQGDKGWMIRDMNLCSAMGMEVDVVDISAMERDSWLPRLEAAEILLFGGGNSYHLMHWMQKSGLQEILPELLQTRVYVGISAGSCQAGPTLANAVQDLFDESYEIDVRNGLALVDFHIVPHLNSPYFEKIRVENLAEASKQVSEPVYALDDQSAVLVDGEDVEVISEGAWKKFN